MQAIEPGTSVVQLLHPFLDMRPYSEVALGRAPGHAWRRIDDGAPQRARGEPNRKT